VRQRFELLGPWLELELKLGLELELELEPEPGMEWGLGWEAVLFEDPKVRFLEQVYDGLQWQLLSLYHCSRSEPAKVPAPPSRTDPQESSVTLYEQRHICWEQVGRVIRHCQEVQSLLLQPSERWSDRDASASQSSELEPESGAQLG
jgi:hypothetical protein